MKLCSVYNGLLIFSKYHDCDPVHSGLVKKNDQIFAYYVLDVAQKIPGLPGLFVVGIFSAALSSMSTIMNTLAGTIYDDFVRTRFNFKESTASTLIKSMVVFIGVLCLVLVFVVEKLGSVFSLAISVSGVTSGTLLGIFFLGMFSPRINAKVRRESFFCTGIFIKLAFQTGCILGSNYFTGCVMCDSSWSPDGNSKRQSQVSESAIAL